MLPRAQRIRTAQVFTDVRRDGRAAGTSLLSVGAKLRAADADGAPRFGFVVSRRVGKATVRNLVKRRLRATAQALRDTLAGWDVVVTARPSAATASFVDLSLAMTSAIQRLKPRAVAVLREAQS